MGRLDDPRLDALRPHLRATDGGMSAFAPTNPNQQWNHQNELYTANQVPRLPGQFVVDMHGSADSVRIGNTPLSPRDLADIIRSNPDYDGGPVSLLGCGTGSTPNGFAAQLAQELGVPVTAPSRDAWVDHDGNVFASSQEFNADSTKPARPTWPPNGQWSTFSPNGEQTVHQGPFPPGHTPTWASGDTPARPMGTAAHRGDETGGSQDPRAEQADRDADRELRQASDTRNDQLKELQQETSERIAQAERDAAPRLAEVEQSREQRLTEIRESTDRQLANIEREREQRLAEAGGDQTRRDEIDAEHDHRAEAARQRQAEREHAANREADRQAEPVRRELDQKFAEIVAEKDQRRDQIEQDFADRSQAAEAERDRRHTEIRGDQPRNDDGSWREERTQSPASESGDDRSPADQTRDDAPAEEQRPGEESRAPERRDSRSDGRQAWPTDPANDAPLRHRDLDALGLTEQQVDWWRNGQAPLGMDPDQFRRFQSEFGDLLRANGIDPDRAQVRLVGSSVRFYSGWNKTMEGEHGLDHTPESRERFERWQGPDRDGMSERRPFDVQHRLGLKPNPSDYDLSIYSDEVVAAARAQWSDQEGFANERQGYVNKEPMREALPGLEEFARRWEEKTGRKIGLRLFGLENEPRQRRSRHSNPTDGNWLLDLSEREQPQRPDRPVDPASGQELTRRDQEFLGHSDEQLAWWSDGDAPLGMTPRQFHDFQASLAEALRAEGVDARDVDVRLKGSGVNAYSNPRKTLDNAPHTDESRALMDEWFGDATERPTSRPFDSMHRLGLDDKSDFDVQIRSDDLVRMARERLETAPPPGVKRDENGDPHFAHPKYGFVDKAIMREQFPELNKWVEHWERELGREVAPALFGLDDGPRQDSHLDAAKAQRGWPMLGQDASPLGDRPDAVDPGTVGSARPDNVDDPGIEPPRRPSSEPPADSPVLTDAPESPPPPPRVDHGDPVHNEDGSWEWKGYTLDAETNQTVDEFIPKFAELGHGADGDGGVRAVMRDIEQRVPYTKLEGLEYDLKGADRLKEKVADRLDEDGNTQTPEEILRGIPDGVRYTFSLDPENYTSGLVRITDELKQRGFVEVQQVNSWNRDIPYKGVNSRWMDPESGLRFEVQFHTPESWHVKDVTHDAYEHENNMSLDQQTRDTWHDFQSDYFNTIPKPPGAETIVTFKEKKPSD
jgi:hypothetical protein